MYQIPAHKLNVSKLNVSNTGIFLELPYTLPNFSKVYFVVSIQIQD
jgi:hypothetical protein